MRKSNRSLTNNYPMDYDGNQIKLRRNGEWKKRI